MGGRARVEERVLGAAALERVRAAKADVEDDEAMLEQPADDSKYTSVRGALLWQGWW